MKSRQHNPIWPYLVILACLFVLSITAPRAWDRLARHETLSHALAIRTSHPATTDGTASRGAPEPTSVDVAELTGRESIHAEPQAAAPLAPALPLAVPAAPPAPELAEPAVPDVQAAAGPVAPPELDGPSSEADLAEAPPSEPASPEPAPFAWPLPRTLIAQLAQLSQDNAYAPWAGQAAQWIHQLCREGVADEQRAKDLFASLRGLADSSSVVAVADSQAESRVVRVRYALARWVDIWEHAARMENALPAATTQAQEPDRMSACLADVDAFTRKGANGAGWRRYLQVETLRTLTQGEHSADERRAAARRVLDRMTSYRLSGRQQEFMRQGPLAALETELRVWAAEAVAARQLLSHLEAYEHTHLASDARLVAHDFQGLHWSADAQAEGISARLDTHYRNANLRVALTAKLANQLVPQPEKLEGPIDDTIVNVPVVGRSTTVAKLSVRFVPDPRRIRLGLEARGSVDSDTVSTSGPATFYNAGRATFLVRKLMVLGPQGLSVWPAVSEAENDYTYLTSLETNFDGVPLVGPLVRSIARSQLEESRWQAEFEAEYKLAKRSREQLDAEIHPLLRDSVRRVDKEQLATLRGLGLELVPLALSTTEERIVARARLGGADQLGAHTPRPRAPADSWLSLQVHQSAINNTLEKLDLDGRSFALPELFAWMSERLRRPGLAQQEDLPDDVRLTFASKDAVRVRCEEGRVVVMFAFAKLTHRGKSWHNFTVETYYLPEARELEPRLVRGPALRFDGRSVKGKSVPLLRAIFSKVLSPNRDLSLLADSITSDPRLKNLQITQFVVEDGWIGLAYSPQRVPHNVVRRPK